MCIRDRVRFARTLGTVREEHGLEVTTISADAKKSPIFADYTKGTYWSVSYTHLTLPTSDLV